MKIRNACSRRLPLSIHSHASAVDGEGGPQVRFMLVQ
jgi:hypothetical protein